ncbi:hypothetical protein [Leptolyngbya sp. KIOST-1]|uniref:hypothetical protein n=1 Tax=Leptolyngbya sp. KIOST-1 TaxID=1229172 RepID=UPI0005685DCD|nr:hypothetical protein [Leptolyngbya sp. KIOST-1]
MEYWEFLLQKEGDRSWLPLDASQVEILEGRYRVMAHTSHCQTPVRIQISQMLAGEQRDGQRTAAAAPPKRRTLRRQSETNRNGLMVVMPFTRLREGTWDIQCARGDNPGVVSTDSDTSQAWCYAVQLRVVAQDSADDGDWFADDGSADLGASPPQDLPSDSAGATTAPDLDLEAATAAMDAFQAQLAGGLDPDSLPYGLTLPNTALLGSERESLGLSATVTGPPTLNGPPLALVVRLLDPQTAVTVAMVPVLLAVATLPSSVVLSVTLPAGLSTRLLLGEVGLLVGAEVVALHRFTVTVDVASLFDAIANQGETDTDLDVVFPPDAVEPGDSQPRPNPDLKTWDIAGRAAPPREMPILTLPRSSVTLPPKIYYPSPHEVAARQPTLPPVGRPKPAPAPASGTDSEIAPVAPAAGAAPAGAESNRGLSLPPIPTPPPRPTDAAAVLSGQTAAPSSRPRGQEPQLLSHEAMGFKDLKLQDRFWARLNELAVNLQQEALENRSEAIAEVPSIEDSDAVEPLPEFVPFAGEVVIYEDEDPVLMAARTAPAVNPEAAPESPPEAITPPMPSLVLPEGELIAGEPVLVTLRVPFHPNRLYLKIWITDPQTRSLADEPRQVMNLLPNGQGQLEGTLQLTVPLGCLEAWFEAISVDMVTQQESYKTSVSRDIALPGLPPPGLEEFGL